MPDVVLDEVDIGPPYFARLKNFADIPEDGPFYIGDCCKVNGVLYVYEFDGWMPMAEAEKRMYIVNP